MNVLDQLLQYANQIKNQTGKYLNTHQLVGSLFASIIEYLKNIISGQIRQPAVDTYTQLLSTYPNPEKGWTVLVRNDKTIYQWNGSQWVNLETPVYPENVATKDDLTDYAKTETSGGKVVRTSDGTIDLSSKADRKAEFNVSQFNNKYDYINLAEARSAIPANLRGAGQNITFHQGSIAPINIPFTSLGNYTVSSNSNGKSANANNNAYAATVTGLPSIEFQGFTTASALIGGHFLTSTGVFISGVRFANGSIVNGSRVTVAVPDNAVTFEWCYPTDAYATSQGITLFDHSLTSPPSVTNWFTYKYKGVDLSGWNTESNWEIISNNLIVGNESTVPVIISNYLVPKGVYPNFITQESKTIRNEDLTVIGNIPAGNNGNIGTKTNFRTSDKMPVTGIVQIVCKTTYANPSGSNDFAIAYYDSAGAYISASGMSFTGADLVSVPPASAVTYRVSKPSDEDVSFILYLDNTIAVETEGWSILSYENDNWLVQKITDSDSGESSVTSSIVTDNADAIRMIDSLAATLIRTSIGRPDPSGPDLSARIGDKLVFAHITDTHKDSERTKRFFDFINNCPSIQFGVHTGDINDNITDDYNWFTKLVNDSDKKCYLTIGNHELTGYETIAGASVNSYVHNKVIAPIKDRLSLTTDKNYYSIDFSAFATKILFVNMWDYPNVNFSSYYDGAISQTQMDWFVSELKTAKTNGYSVIVMSHQPPARLSTSNAINQNPFFETDHPTFNRVSKRYSGDPFGDIINAWKTGTAINKTYTHDDSSIPSVTVNTTFTGNGDFMFFANGHNHADYHGVSTSYADQLIFNLNTGRTKFADSNGIDTFGSNLPRQLNSPSQDCFNVYIIDKVNRAIHIVRVGANLNYNLTDRKHISFNY